MHVTHTIKKSGLTCNRHQLTKSNSQLNKLHRKSTWNAFKPLLNILTNVHKM